MEKRKFRGSALNSATCGKLGPTHYVLACDVQEVEHQRRLALEQRLAEEDKKDSLKKKRKIKF